MSPRRIFPRRLTIRWFTSRGWAYGGALTFGIAAVWLRPDDLPISTWLLAGGFMFTAVSLALLGTWPESRWLRLIAVAASVSAALIRSWALFNTTSQPLGYRLASAMVWMWIAWCSWMLAMLTAQFATRHN